LTAASVAPARAAIAVLGTGMMGPGIAVVLALAGHRATLWGRSEASLRRGLDRVGQCLDLLKSGRLVASRAAQAARRRIGATSDLGQAVHDASFVFESVAEDLGLKQQLFQQLEGLVADEAVLASNTSGLPITQIAEPLRHPERAATAHFWNPPHLMPLVEVVKGERTSEPTLERLRALLSEAGKQVVVVRKDVPGQLGNRLQHALFREAFHLIESGIASVEDVDRAIKYGPGLRFPAYGLLEHADMVGLDLMIAVESYLFAALSASTEAPGLLRRLVAQGALGAKSGRGLYDWSVRCADDVLAARDKFVLERLKESRRRQRTPS
jgi:3-hydroxybutyryl-CoA dehydrogenase